MRRILLYHRTGKIDRFSGSAVQIGQKGKIGMISLA